MSQSQSADDAWMYTSYRYAADLIKEGLSADETQKKLVEKGLDERTSWIIVSRLAQMRWNALREAASKNLLYGALALIGGIVVSVATYLGAAPGGTYVFWTGAIVYGLLRLYNALQQYYSIKALTKRKPTAGLTPRVTLPRSVVSQASLQKARRAVFRLALVVVLVGCGVVLVRVARDILDGRGREPTATAGPTAIVKENPTSEATRPRPPTTGPRSPFGVYHDDRLGLSIGYPEGWKFAAGEPAASYNVAPDAPYGVVFYAHSLNVLPMSQIYVIRGKSVQGSQFRELSEQLIGAYEAGLRQDESLSDVQRVREWVELKVDGWPGYASGYITKVNGIGDVFAVTMVTGTDDDTYIGTWASLAATQDETCGMFEAMASSIHFLD